MAEREKNVSFVVEYTDTFCGEANYAWCRNATINVPENASWRAILKEARENVGLTGVRGDIIANYGDEIHWKPRGACTILMVRVSY